MDKKGILASLRLLLSTQNSLDEAPGVKCSELAVCTDTCHSENDLVSLSARGDPCR